MSTKTDHSLKAIANRMGLTYNPNARAGNRVGSGDKPRRKMTPARREARNFKAQWRAYDGPLSFRAWLRQQPREVVGAYMDRKRMT